MPAANPPHNLSQALKWIKGKVGTTGWHRRCLEIFRLAWGWEDSISGLPTAYSGWTQTKKKHRRDYNPPPGAPCWFKGPTSAGHVCFSTGNGQVITNDYPTSNRMNKSTIRAIEKGWDCEYLGWTEDYPRRGDLPLDLVGQKPPAKKFGVGDRVAVSTKAGLQARSGPGTEKSTLTGRTVAFGYRFEITKLYTEDGILWGKATKYTYALVDASGKSLVKKI